MLRSIGLPELLVILVVAVLLFGGKKIPELAKGFIGAVAESRNPQTAGALLEHWSQLTPASRRTTISALLRRTEWVDALLDAVDQGQLKRPDIAAEYWGQLKSNPNQKISARAQRLEGAKPAASSAEMDALTKKLLPIAAQKGDFKRGQEVFESVCINCHTFEGKGAKIGPELTGIGARSRADILVDIIDPNRSVEANFRQWSVTTKAGETLAGRLETETQTSIEILDLTGQKHVVQRKEITNLEASNLSIMPIGFEALPESDLASLLEYLTSSPHAAKK